MWPTVTAAAATQGQNEYDGKRGQTLVGAVRGQMWGTPRAAAGMNRRLRDPRHIKDFSRLEDQVALLPTPRAGLTGRISPARTRDRYRNLETVLSRMLFPTPTAGKHSSNVADPRDLVDSRGRPWRLGKKPHDRRSGKMVTTTLMDFVRLLPTPTANDAKCNATESQRQRNSIALNVWAALFPTPTASDATQWNTMTAAERRRKGNAVRLGNALSTETHRVGGHLNPAWVEWLMGYPEGWTDLEHSATPSSPR